MIYCGSTIYLSHSDDAMAIFVALQSPEVQVIGLTTIYGNVYTTLATRNALHLVNLFTFYLRLVLPLLFFFSRTELRISLLLCIWFSWSLQGELIFLSLKDPMSQ